MMRRSNVLLVAAAFALVVCPGGAFGAVYEAPHYQAPVTYQQAVYSQASYGYGQGMCCPAPACGPCDAWGYNPGWGESPCDKLSRGVVNALTGWIEIPKYLVTGAFNCNVNPLDGIGVGLVRGVSRAVERTAIGVWEAATFPFPGCGPLLLPEYVSLDCCGNNWRYGNYVDPMCSPCGPGCPPPYYAPQGRPAQVGAWGPALQSSDARRAPAPQPMQGGMPGGMAGAPSPYPADDFLK